ncbi:MAG: translation initiation factor IF-2 [Magnetospirillum sp. WYHS-4]
MTDMMDQDKKPLTLGKSGKLELKKTVESGSVKQSFSHGRSKMVQVEVRKKRTFAQDASGHMAEVKVVPELTMEAPPPPPEAPEVIEPHLTSHEKAARMRALKLAEEEETRRRLAEEEERRRRAEAGLPSLEEERQAREEEDRRKSVEEEEVRRQSEDETRRRNVEEEDKRRKPDDAPAPREDGKAPAAAPAAKPHVRPADAEEEDDSRGPRRSPGSAARPEHRRAPVVRRIDDEARRSSGRLSIQNVSEDGEAGERQRSLASVRRAREKEKKKAGKQQIETVKIVREVVLPEVITVQELASRMAERGAAVIKILMKMGVMATINQVIDADTAELVAGEFGHTVRRVSESDVEIGLEGGTDHDETLMSRPPVVTVMGHVDHGKTSLLDALRATDVVSGEAGGITQHIGAYQVALANGAKITFVDTPGHAAFTEMRARGAKVTDIVVLVVAADDGVMPQTIEAIHHAKAAGVPIIVAINKMDKPDANPQRVRTELLSHEIVVEDMGGDTQSIEVSAKARLNLDKLEEAILLQAEVLDLKANPNRLAQGVIVEAKMERGRGSVATVLVQKGTLRVGDVFVAGSEWGRVRALSDSRGEKVDEAQPGMPVEILGLNGTPAAGDDFIVAENENKAREVAEFRQRKAREARAAAGARGSLEQMLSRIQDGQAKVLPVVVKGDVHGSVEAICGAIEQLATEEVKVQVLHSGVGGINESDVTLARASQALIIGFNVRANPQAREMANRDGVDIRYYSIIYNLTDDLRKALSGMLAPSLRENFLGYAEIREVFNISKVGKVAGCMVTQGVVKRGAKVRLLRDNVVIHEGALSQLKRFKDDAREVKEGYDCGMALANYHDIQVGDVIECFEVEEVAREL